MDIPIKMLYFAPGRISSPEILQHVKWVIISDFRLLLEDKSLENSQPHLLTVLEEFNSTYSLITPREMVLY